MTALVVNLEERGRDAVLAEPRDDVDNEEGRPAEEEDAHDDPDGDGRLVLQVQRRLGRGRRRRRGLGGPLPSPYAVALLPPPLAPQPPRRNLGQHRVVRQSPDVAVRRSRRRDGRGLVGGLVDFGQATVAVEGAGRNFD